MRYHYITIKTVKTKIVKTLNDGEEEEKLDHSYTTGENVNSTVTLEISLAVSYKSKHAVPYDSAMVLLGIYPREMKTYVHTKPVYECSQHF